MLFNYISIGIHNMFAETYEYSKNLKHFWSWFLIIDSTASDMSIDTNVRFKQYVIPLYGSYWVNSIFKPMKYAIYMRTIGKYI